MSHHLSTTVRVAVAAAALALSNLAGAALVSLTITAENLAQPNSISFAPLHFGVNNGTFDAFNIGQVATAPIISVAEGGGGMAWQTAFGMADPNATRGTIGGLLQPGQTRNLTILVDTAINSFFTFAAMAVPSNDFFIGNDSATEFRLFDAAGNLLITTIGQKARQIWDAGSEAFDPLAAAFVGNNDLRTPQNSVVSFNFSELAGFDGLTTGAGYLFNSGLTADTDIYRISFSAVTVPEPGTLALVTGALLLVGAIGRRRREYVQV